MLYLDVSSDECHRRVHEVRQRSCESGIPLEYLSGLGSCYASLVQEMQSRGCPVMAVNWNGFGDPNEVATKALCSLSKLSFKIPVELQAQLNSSEHMRLALSASDLQGRDHFDSPDYLPSVEQIKAFISALAASAEEMAPFLCLLPPWEATESQPCRQLQWSEQHVDIFTRFYDTYAAQNEHK